MLSFAAVLASARPGEDGRELFGLLTYLVFEQPLVGTILLAFAVFIYGASRHGGGQDWDSGTGGLGLGPGPMGREPAVDLQVLTAVDPGFSVVEFEDLVRQSYAWVHSNHVLGDQLAGLPIRFESELWALLRARGVPLTSVLVGSLRAVRVELPRSCAFEVEVEVEIDARIVGKSPLPTYLRDRWVLRRALAAGSDWRVVTARELAAVREPPGLFAVDVVDSGVRLPTVFDPDLPSRWKELIFADPEVSSGSIESRLHLIFRELNRASLARRVGPARAHLADGVVESLRYWHAVEVEAGLIHRFDDARISALELVRVARDRCHDVLSFRVELTGRECWVRDDDARVVRGDPQHERSRCEYWTLIRRAGTRGRARDDGGCPSCGAPLQISPAGFCVHCDARLGAGEFDWVLARIDADEVYAG